MKKLKSCQENTVYLISYFEDSGISAVEDQILAWSLYSQFNIKILNLYKTFAGRGMVLPDPEVVKGSAAVIIHPSVAYSPVNLQNLCASFLPKYRPRGPILLYKQDEHVEAHVTDKIIEEFGIEILLTCTPEESWSLVYPKSLKNRVNITRVLTGYFTDKMVSAMPLKRWEERKIDLFYRGSKQPPEIGRLGFEKYILSNWVKEACKSLNTNINVSSESEHLVYGYDWYNMLCGSRGILGTETGSNCFDLDGALSRKVSAYLAQNKSLDPWSEEGYKHLHGELLSSFEGNVNYGQIAPRHLEAVATKSVQVLLPGTYSGILKANRHYLELNPDLSNIGEVIETLSNKQKFVEVTDCAYEEVLCNPNYHYKSFITKIDQMIIEKIPRTWTKTFKDTKAKKNVLLVCPHKAHLDPRIKWWSENASNDWDVKIIESSHEVFAVGGKVTTKSNPVISARTNRVRLQNLPLELLADRRFEHVINLLQRIEFRNRVWKKELKYNGESTQHIRALQHLYQASVGLTEAALRVSGIDLVIATDLPSLPAGVILKEIHNVPLIYDAQEIWHFNASVFDPMEVREWIDLEKKLLDRVDFPVTVSPGIADWYMRNIGVSPYVIPNFVPLNTSIDKNIGDIPPDEPIKFLFMGGFAEERGIDRLIEAWDIKASDAILTLHGGESPYKLKCKSLAEIKNKKGCKIVFGPSLSEDQLIETAKKHHIGIIPYIYRYPYSHCSPNKFSQYLAGGCAVLTHDLPFLAELVDKTGCGIISNFRSPFEISGTLNSIVNNKKAILGWRKNAGAAVSQINWEAAVHQLVEEVNILPNTSLDDFSVLRNYRKLKPYIAKKILPKNDYSFIEDNYMTVAHMVAQLLGRKSSKAYSILLPAHNAAKQFLQFINKL